MKGRGHAVIGLLLLLLLRTFI